MTSTTEAKRDAFGMLRLLFASLVIVSHTAELADGDGRREPLEHLVGTTNLGFVAVYGFFLVSGYLITASLVRSRSPAAFLRKRCARIYPGFALASLVSVAIVLPLSGGAVPAHGAWWLTSTTARIVLLQRPVADGAFAGQHFHQTEVALNGAMWTIPYEFGCYLLVGVLGARSILRRRGLVAMAAAGALLGSVLLPDHIVNLLTMPALLAAGPRLGLALPGMFATGACFFLWRERIRFDGRGAIIAAIVLTLAVPVPALTLLALATAGGYLVFAAARCGAGTSLAGIGERTDTSYGLYLYAWPIEQLLIRGAGTGNLVLLATATWLLAAAAGWCSWVAVERPALRRFGQRDSHGARTAITRKLAP